VGASASDPIGNSKNKQHDNEDFKKRVHDRVGLVPTQFKANKGLRDLDLDQTTGGFTGALEQKEKGPAIPTGPFPHELALLSLW
jgi:hypothetical protein